MKFTKWIRPLIYFMLLLLLSLPLQAQDKDKGKSKGNDDEVVDMSGISIIGNRELPKTLFIVPWKNSEVNVETDLTNTLNEGLQPLDQEVFRLELEYYDFVHSSD